MSDWRHKLRRSAPAQYRIALLLLVATVCMVAVRCAHPGHPKTVGIKIITGIIHDDGSVTWTIETLHASNPSDNGIEETSPGESFKDNDNHMRYDFMVLDPPTDLQCLEGDLDGTALESVHLEMNTDGVTSSLDVAPSKDGFSWFYDSDTNDGNNAPEFLKKGGATTFRVPKELANLTKLTYDDGKHSCKKIVIKGKAWY